MDGPTITYPIIHESGAKTLKCVDCGEEFVFTVNAQEYFKSRRYADDPKRCKNCFHKRKREKEKDASQLASNNQPRA